MTRHDAYRRAMRKRDGREIVAQSGVVSFDVHGVLVTVLDREIEYAKGGTPESLASLRYRCAMHARHKVPLGAIYK